MKTPFINDPFALIAKAFEGLYPTKHYTAMWGEGLKDEIAAYVFGVTTFPDDGSYPEIQVSWESSVFATVELFAHELAHVAVGIEHEHDEEWLNAFGDIWKEYNRIGETLFDGQCEAGEESK